METIILYIVVTYLIGLGVQLNQYFRIGNEKKVKEPVLWFLISPIILPIYYGWRVED